MTEKEFIGEVYNGLNMIYRGLGAVMAAIAKRYAMDKMTSTPRPKFTDPDRIVDVSEARPGS